MRSVHSRVDGIAPQPDRIDALDELSGIVFLRDEIDGVGAVGEWPRAIPDADPIRHQERFAILALAAQVPNDIGAVRRHRLALRRVAIRPRHTAMWRIRVMPRRPSGDGKRGCSTEP